MVEKKVVKKSKVSDEVKTSKKPTKKAAVKKETVKKETVKKAVVAKKTVQDYVDVINWKKWEAHHMNWLYIEINAGDLLNELEAGVSNLKTCCGAVLDSMLEGDEFIVEPKGKTKVSNTLTVRYYVDNLSPERNKYEVA